MTTYKKLHGRAIRSVSTNLSDSGAEGQIWFNTTDNQFKSIVSSESFSSAAPLTTARNGAASFGTQTAGAVGLGAVPASPYNSTATEHYNGTGWSNGGTANTARRYLTGFGIQTAGVACGGFAPNASNASEEYNGSSWTSGNNINTARYFNAGAGILTAGVMFGGNTGGTGYQVATEEYDGTNWTSVNNMNTARGYLAGTGTQTAALGFGGYSGSNTAATEEYDGTNWTSSGNLNTARRNVSGGGIQTNAQAFGGQPATTAFEKYDGTSWTTSPLTLTVAHQAAGTSGQSGSQTANFIASGDSPHAGVTEEYNVSTSVITAAAWAAGGSISTVRTNVGSTSEGSQTAAMVWGGRTGPPPSGPYTSNKSDTYDGSSFSTAPNLNTASRTRSGGGTTSAAWCAGGTSPTYINSTEEFNGSSWTSVTNAPLVFFAAGTGAQTAGLIVGINSDVDNPGGSDAYPGISLEYDGTNWATGGSPSADRTSAGCSGTQTAGTLISGQNAPGTSPGGALVTTIEEYNGSSWTSGGASLVAVKDNQAACRGTQTATLITGGNINPPAAGITSCSIYDGTSTATTANMGTGRRGHGSDGGPSSGLVMTGQSAGPPANNNPNYTANAEEFTTETTAVNVKTLTQS